MDIIIGIIKEVVIAIISGMIGGIAGANTVIKKDINKQKQVNKENSTGIQAKNIKINN